MQKLLKTFVLGLAITGLSTCTNSQHTTEAESWSTLSDAVTQAV